MLLSIEWILCVLILMTPTRNILTWSLTFICGAMSLIQSGTTCMNHLIITLFSTFNNQENRMKQLEYIRTFVTYFATNWTRDIVGNSESIITSSWCLFYVYTSPICVRALNLSKAVLLTFIWYIFAIDFPHYQLVAKMKS